MTEIDLKDPLAQTELVAKFQLLQGRVIDAGATLLAGNFEALLDDLNSLERDVNDMRDAVWGTLNPEEE